MSCQETSIGHTLTNLDTLLEQYLSAFLIPLQNHPLGGTFLRLSHLMPIVQSRHCAVCVNDDGS